MPLKIFKNGVIHNLTSTATPLVTFVNGVKKKLPKGVTFINGEKVVLWDANELQITYINPEDMGLNPYDPSVAFFANKDLLLYSFQNTIYKLNVSNKANPSLIGSVQFGDVIGYSSVDSVVGESVYYAYNTSGGATFNQLNITNSSGNIVVSNAQNLGNTIGVEKGAYIGGKWLSCGVSRIGTAYMANVYENATRKYGYSVYSGGGSISGKLQGPLFTKLDSSTMVGRLNIYNSTNAVAEYDVSGYTVKTGSCSYMDFLTDGNIIACAGSDGFELFERPASGNYVSLAKTTGIANHTDRLIGKCRGYYYTVSCPFDNDSEKKYYLRVYDSDGVLYKTVELTGLNGLRYSYITSVPQLSRTGYLTIYIPKYSSGKSCFLLIQCY